MTGLTMVASTACCEPCQRASPFATTSMRRSSDTGTSMFMSAAGGHDGRHAHRLLGRPAQQRVQEGGPGRRALRKLRRQPCDRRVGQGDHGRRTYAGATGSGKRSRRSSNTRNNGEVTVNSADLGKTVKARAACGPACDSSSARDAASR